MTSIRLNPGYAGTYINMANAQRGLERYDRAIAALDEALKVEPDNADAYANRGESYLRKDDEERALADLDRAISLDPRNATFYYSRAEVYVRQAGPQPHHRGRGEGHEAQSQALTPPTISRLPTPTATGATSF